MEILKQLISRKSQSGINIRHSIPYYPLKESKKEKREEEGMKGGREGGRRKHDNHRLLAFLLVADVIRARQKQKIAF